MLLELPNGNTMFLTITAIDVKTGEKEVIKDLYWFEENGVHDFEGRGHNTNYQFEISLKIQNNNMRRG